MTGIIQRFGNTLSAHCRKIFHAFALPRVCCCLPVLGITSTGCQSRLDRALLRAIRVITNNHSADFNHNSYVATNICCFKRVLFSCNVCRIFNIVHENSANHYLNTKMSSDGAVNCIPSATHCKIVPLNPNRLADGHCFQITAIRENNLPFNVTSLTDFNIFKNRVSVILNLFLAFCLVFKVLVIL